MAKSKANSFLAKTAVIVYYRAKLKAARLHKGLSTSSTEVKPEPARKRIMPNFFIIGAGKSGTTSLYVYLKQHPEIYMSPVKEPNFFAFCGEDVFGYELSDLKWILGSVTRIDDYCALFSDVKNQKERGEASGLYLFHPRAAKRIHDLVPDAKLIAILRNPVERAYSGYTMHVRRGSEFRSFENAIQEDRNCTHYFRGSYVEKGFYYLQLQRYFDLFERDQVRVFLYEDLCNHPKQLLRRCFSFLQCETTFVPDVLTTFNQAPRKYRIPKKIAASLVSTYREDISALESLIERDLSSWLR